MSAEESSVVSEETQKAEQDWRLEAKLETADTRGALHRLVGRARSPEVVREIEASVPNNVVITHDGRLLFAYAASEAGLATARSAIENVLRQDGIQASLRISHWDDELDRWRQTDPPPSVQEKLTEEAADRDADAIETRAVVATSGKVVRDDFERSMSEWADKLGLECKIVEHPHLLTTQVVFTVTGPRRKIDEFSQGLVAEGWAFIRADDAVMLSPL
jgi:hypothetical protein